MSDEPGISTCCALFLADFSNRLVVPHKVTSRCPKQNVFSSLAGRGTLEVTQQ